MADQSGRLAALAQNVEKFEERLAEVCEDMAANGGREERFADKISKARRKNDISGLPNSLKALPAQLDPKQDLDRAQQKNRDLEAENQSLRSAGGDSSDLRRERRKNLELEGKNQDLTDRNVVLDRKNRDNEDKIQRLERENRNLRQQLLRNGQPNNNGGNLRWFQDQIDTLRQDKSELESKITQLEREKATLKTKKDDLKAANKKLTEDKEALTDEKLAMFKKYDKSIWGSLNPNCTQCQKKEDHYCGGAKSFRRKK